jgi:hypothetical protein
MLANFIIQWVENALNFLKDKVDKQTPEDTGLLSQNNKKQPVRKIWDWIKWTLINETPYAPYVEYWVWGKSYNYYKNGGRKSWASPFYRGVWARMYTKAQFENQNTVRNLIMEKINEWIKIFNNTKKK